MKKFSSQVLMNENTSNTFTLGKKIDVYPEFWDDIKDIIEVYKSSYGDVAFCRAGYGWVNENTIKEMYSAQSINLTGQKGIRKIFPDGDVADKWCISCKIIIKWDIIKSDWVSTKKGDWITVDVWQEKDLDILINRTNSIKTLSKRLGRWCDVYMTTLNNGFKGEKSDNGSPSICILAIVRNDSL